jgi:succinate dehydrogenase hydrophobic anchor subunit
VCGRVVDTVSICHESSVTNSSVLEWHKLDIQKHRSRVIYSGLLWSLSLHYISSLYNSVFDIIEKQFVDNIVQICLYSISNTFP